MPRADRCDVVVIGGGPAGSTAAHLLASWGWSVVLLHQPAHRPALAESLPASIKKLLALLALRDPVERAAFHPNTGNVARWAGHGRDTQSDAAGYHVSRDRFDAVLRDAAAQSGAVVISGRVTRVVLDGTRAVTYTSDAAHAVRSRFILDCSGRAGVVARMGFRRVRAGYRTVAVAAEWDCPDWPVAERERTAIESCDDGWAWSVPVSARRRQCTVMIEPARGRQAIADVYDRHLAHTTLLRDRLRSATRVSPPWTCDASLYDCSRAADAGVLLVGDAASFIEPLSSAGVKKALLSAWRAAVVTNTCLRDSTREHVALDFYDRRERHVHDACAQQAAGFFAEAQDAHGTDFWRRRAADNCVSDPSRADSLNLDDAALAASVDVRSAFDFLRRADGVRLKMSDALRFTEAATIEGREIVLRDALVAPGVGIRLQHAAGVDLPALARLARDGGDVPALITAYQAHVAPAPVAGVLAGLSVLVAHRALVPEGSPS